MPQVCKKSRFIKAATMSAKPYLKVSLFIKKLPNISHEQFRAHWKGPHVDIALKNDTFVRLVRKYNQVYSSFGTNGRI